MNKPKLPEALTLTEDFTSHCQNLIREETQVIGIRVQGGRVEGEDFSGLEIQQSQISRTVFHQCGFARASFRDVVFSSCDFSNSVFLEAYFERCSFISCKCVGINMSETVLKHTTFDSVNLKYAQFHKARITDVLFRQVDLTEAFLTECAVKRLQVNESRFLKTSFFHTMLSGVDFTSCELVAPTVSSPPAELKGAVINQNQAVDLIGLWGITVK